MKLMLRGGTREEGHPRSTAEKLRAVSRAWLNWYLGPKFKAGHSF